MDIEVEDYMKSINLESVCRTCLSDCEEMTSLFSEVMIEDSEVDEEIDTYVFLYDILTNVSTLQILTDDGLPTLICKKCMEYATNAYKFKVNCERTETLLQTYLSKRINIKQEDVTSREPDIEELADEITIEGINDESEEMIEEQIEKDNPVSELDDGSSEQSLCIQEVVVNPDVDATNISLCEDSTVSLEFEEKYTPPDENEEKSVAAFVASSEENVRLRQRIAMKKMRSLENGKSQPKMYVPVNRRRKPYFHSYTMNEKGEKIYTCPVCKKEYKHSTSLTVHLRSHTMERPYLCNLCGKGFKQFTGLNYHMRSHSGEQPYACTLCDKKYRQSASLTAHMRVHTGQRPFLCSVCGKGFRQAPDLGYHMRTHTQEKPYMCSVCGKRMSMQCHLVQHMRTHTGEKPYACTECGKSFASTTRLKRHEIIHTDLKPYACKICSKAFNRASTLRVHSMIHSEERPHVCHLCGKGFIQAHCLRSHLNTHQK